jgi:hypothetical protein
MTERENYRIRKYEKDMRRKFQDFLHNYNSRTIFVALYTHGEIWLDERNDLNSFPQPVLVKKVITINETHPGKINICSNADTDRKVEKINTLLHELGDVSHNIEDTANHIVDELIKYDEDNPRTDLYDDPEYMDYASTKGLYRTMSYNYMDYLARKQFSGKYARDKVEILDYVNNETIDISFKWKTRGNTFKFQTGDLLNFLKQEDFSTVVLLDFSCSFFVVTNSRSIALDEPDGFRFYRGDNTRYLQYKLMSEGLAGGRQKTKTNKKYKMKKKRNTRKNII